MSEVDPYGWKKRATQNTVPGVANQYGWKKTSGKGVTVGTPAHQKFTNARQADIALGMPTVDTPTGTPSAKDSQKAQQDGMTAALALLKSLGFAGASAGSGAGSAGGAGGVGSNHAIGNAALAQFNSGNWQQPYTAQTNALNTLYDTAKTNIGNSNSAYLNYLQQSQVNPYADFHVAASSAAPAATALLQSQGVDPSYVNAQVQASQGALDSQATAMNRMIDMLSKSQQVSNQSALSNAQLMGANALGALDTNKAAFQAQINAAQGKERQNLLDSLQSMAMYGYLDPKKLKGVV